MVHCVDMIYADTALYYIGYLLLIQNMLQRHITAQANT